MGKQAGEYGEGEWSGRGEENSANPQVLGWECDWVSKGQVRWPVWLEGVRERRSGWGAKQKMLVRDSWLRSDRPVPKKDFGFCSEVPEATVGCGKVVT